MPLRLDQRDPDFDLRFTAFLSEKRETEEDVVAAVKLQELFGLADSPAASATTIADLRGLKIGVAAGTTSVDYSGLGEHREHLGCARQGVASLGQRGLEHLNKIG